MLEVFHIFPRLWIRHVAQSPATGQLQFRTMEGVGDIPEYSGNNQSRYSVAAGFGLYLYLKGQICQAPALLTPDRLYQCTLTAITCHARNFKKNSSPAQRNSYARFLTHDATVPSQNFVGISESLMGQLSRLPMEGLVCRKPGF